MIQELQKYNKFLIALLGAVLATLSQFYADNQYVQLAIAFFTALGVYVTPNKG